MGERDRSGTDGAADREWTRRDFLQAVAATLAAAGLPACNAPPEPIVPYTRRPGGLVPGVPLHFATSWDLDGNAAGLLVESREGRPVKIEGNPAHPSNQGAASAWEQAALLGLYDPDRLQRIEQRGLPRPREALRAALLPDRMGDGGSRLRVLVSPSSSPLQAELRARVGRRFPRAKWAAWSSVARDNVREGARLAFGRPLQPRYRLGEAEVVLLLDADLEGGGEALRLQRELSRRRVVEPTGSGGPPTMSRIYAVEPRPGLAGMYADHRVPLRAVDVEGLARALLAEVATRTGGALAATVADRRTALAGAGGRDERLLAALAGDLVKAGPKAAVVVGPRQPKVVHAIAHALHEALGCVGHTVELVPPAVDAVPSGPEALRALCDEMRAGAVETLVITAWNPVYAAPADLDFAGALGKVPHALYLGSHRDETCPHVEWVVPEAHFLESWGDTRSPEGVVALSQPLIAPLFGGVCATELLSLLLPDDAVEATPPSLTAATAAQRATNEPLPPRGQPPVATTELRAQPQAAPAQRPADNRRTWLLLQATWQQILGRGADFQGAWETALQRGTITSWGTAADASPPPAPAPLDHAALAAALRASAPPPGEGLELSFSADPRLYDGRFANNPWLLELPEPSSALTWDNALELSPRTASRLGLSTGGLVEARWHGRTLRVPALVMPGHADDAASITLGWGRQGALRNGAGAGANANALRDSRHFWFGTGLTLAKTGERHPLSFSQEQLDAEGRPVAIELTLSSLLGQPGQLLPERTPLQTLYSPHPYPDHRWGMAIDLARCTGCSACVIACQAENNVPWVGKEQVGRGRIMHWVRVDRYLQGGGGRRIPLPLMCVHCEMAPCEYVCPVNATVHSDEGLNEMVYNRCVGTRYCSNNCPYKVRRFNYFDWHPDARMLPVLRMAQNPDVTVRSRGVMEKCSYCVQRIEEERIESRVAGRPMRSPATACQQTCPTEAIVFGDLNDRSLEVTRRHGSARAYHLLHELNTRPRTAHLARVRNPHPDLPPEPADHA